MMVLLPDVHDDDEDNDGDDNDDDDGFLHKTKKNTNCPLVNPQISTHFSQFATGFCAHFRIFSLSFSLSLCLSCKCLFITFSAYCDITWAFFNKLLIIYIC